MEELVIRDFIYLDVDRLKSILSQIEKGIIESQEKISTSEAGTSIHAKAGILSFLEASGNVNFLWSDQDKGTYTLHDYIFNKVENYLRENSLIFDDISQYNDLKVNTFVLSQGLIAINDYELLTNMYSNFKELYRYILDWNLRSRVDLNDQQKQKEKHDQLSKTSDTDIKGILKFCDMFYKNRLSVIMTVQDEVNKYVFEGPLSRKFLREDIHSIIYKYGSRPKGDWKILSLIASLPNEEDSAMISPQTGNSVADSINTAFESFRGIEAQALKISSPNISITPIAVYR